MRRSKDYILLLLKGMAMGAADVVPGVSGGTIAFISGIYEELIDTINRINLPNLKLFFRGRWGEFWKAINGNFIVALFGGIIISILSLSRLIEYLLHQHPIAIWSFFFGLVIASILLVNRQIKSYTAGPIIAFIIGAAVAWFVTELPPVSNPGASWYIFLSGAIAICAMILPGISGSFILVILGSYATILGALNALDVVTVLIFIAGAVVGLLSFSRLLKWTFSRFHDITVATLCGFLLGSLNKIWPWKETLQYFTKHAGEPNEELVPLVERNVLPGTYEQLTGEPAHLVLAIGLGLAGFVLIFALEKIAAGISAK